MAKIEGDSLEAVALELLYTVARIEKKELVSDPAHGWTMADRRWLLDAMAECQKAARGIRP